ncbi:enoyl-CoA hydratase domain-containing protein 3, mitochondrial isoform X1 [Gopherus evgoodei]|uniref:Enoyl-CoA hydratase domain-containing protein 3, mitochondrial n=1 Tax=Gopherus evgoodei TaxID=1825980 RepID=A0A8C4VPZ7_9SAUR|nr:enoyl-CoA hydratase domain-containing protein 3, mitochondrial isoform X1 [Gopherus evgoodei]
MEESAPPVTHQPRGREDGARRPPVPRGAQWPDVPSVPCLGLRPPPPRRRFPVQCPGPSGLQPGSALVCDTYSLQLWKPPLPRRPIGRARSRSHLGLTTRLRGTDCRHTGRPRGCRHLGLTTRLRGQVLPCAGAGGSPSVQREGWPWLESAEGPVFSAGHDLKELSSEQDTKHHIEVFETCAEVMTLLQKLPVPVIAKVNGLATAAGCQLVASCDIAVASEKSRFATPGVNIGLFCSTPAVAVGRALSRKVALEMLFTGEPISAHDALLHGLLSRVVPEDKLEEETMKIAHKICETSRSVVALGKATFYKQMALDLDAAYRMTSQVMVDNLTLKDGQEGIEAFIQKRKPTWSHSVNTACK